VVAVGQVIGKADSTGNSSGPHLHLTLKRDGTTQRRETNYPKDIIDPTPFMVWPEEDAQEHSKAAAPIPWAAGRALIGAHGRLGGPMEEADIVLVAEARLEAIKLSLTETRETIERLQAINPGILLATRVTADLSGDELTPERFLATVGPDLGRHYVRIRTGDPQEIPICRWKGGGVAGEEERNSMVGTEGRGLHPQELPDARLGVPGSSGTIAGQRADWSEFWTRRRRRSGIGLGRDQLCVDRSRRWMPEGGCWLRSIAAAIPISCSASPNSTPRLPTWRPA
jgi:hypothetical protein